MEESGPDMSVDEIRSMANYQFSKGDYDSALPLYDAAVEMVMESDGGTLGESAVIHLSNRSACLLKMDRVEEAMKSAEDAVKASDGKNVKSYFRLARTQMALYDKTSAMTSIRSALTHISTLPPSEIVDAQTKELEKLLTEARQLRPPTQKKLDITTLTTIKQPAFTSADYQPSIKEFTLTTELGVGNFSQVVVATHRHTREEFALKVIEKKKAESLAKRQHPNVYNEIQMERRILMERLRPHPHDRIVKGYYAFQDYNSLYFLMELYHGDLWGEIKWKNKMVGCHPSLVFRYMGELLDAVEHLHRHGIVHRDLKPENVLLDRHGRLIVMDFGTAKDLVNTDLNGPEFVGTPDFMSPEAINSSGSKKAGADHSCDLWALGAILHQMITGKTPFASKSPYLTFLRIQRGNLYRDRGVVEDEEWHLLQSLLKVDPSQRLGADCFHFEGFGPKSGTKPLEKPCQNYDIIRNHPFFHLKSNRTSSIRIPTLQDLCIRSIQSSIELDSKNIDLDLDHLPPSKDLFRLSEKHRNKIAHILDRLTLLPQPRIHRRFFRTKQEARLTKIRQGPHTFIGLDMFIHNPNAPPVAENEEPKSMEFIHLVHPLFLPNSFTEEQHKNQIENLKATLRKINKFRPRALVVSGSNLVDPVIRKILAKINETIPVVLNDGTSFFEFWVGECQCLVLASHLLGDSPSPQKEEMKQWLLQQCEQGEMSQHSTFVFLNDDPKRSIPDGLLHQFVKGKVLAVMGISQKSYNINYQIETGEEPMDQDWTEEKDKEDDEFEKKAGKVSLKSGSDEVRFIVTDEDCGWTCEDFLEKVA